MKTSNYIGQQNVGLGSIAKTTPENFRGPSPRRLNAQKLTIIYIQTRTHTIKIIEFIIKKNLL